MDGAIRLLNGRRHCRCIATTMEDNTTAGHFAAYPVVTAVQPGSELQEQCNRQTLDPSQATSRKWPFRNFVDAQCSGETSPSVAPYRRGGPSNQFRFFLDRDFGD